MKTKGLKMSLGKSIESGKEKRKSYRGSKAWDCSCRNNGSCSVCKNNRLHKNIKRANSSEYYCQECFDVGCDWCNTANQDEGGV